MVFRSAGKTQAWWKTFRSYFLCSLVEFRSAEKSKISQPIRGWVVIFSFPIGPKNTNLAEDVEILLPVLPFSGCRDPKSKYRPITGHPRHWQLWGFYVPSFILEGPYAMRSMPGIEHKSPATIPLPLPHCSGCHENIQ